MKWKYGAACLFALFLTGAAAAASLSDTAGKVLPPSMAVHRLAGDRSLTFRGDVIPYHAWQLVMSGRKKDVVLTGYIFEAKIPAASHAELEPFFQYRLTEENYRGLSEVNKAFFDEVSLLHRALVQSVSDWADGIVGGTGAHLETILSDLEPIRRVSGVKSALYTAGARLTFSSEGIIFPLYACGYFYRDGDDYCGLMLLAPDESKRPLSYAMEDIAIQAADEAATRNREAFMKKLGNGQQMP